MARQENTKEKFIYEALRLFSERGYDAVKISEIADAVGCTAPALYKHYENKKKLYDAILEESIVHFEKSLNNQYELYERTTNNYTQLSNLSLEEIISSTQDILRIPLHNDVIANFRKLSMIEQFHNPELAKLYDERYILKHFEAHAVLFDFLIKNDKMKPGDPYSRAVSFVSPVIVLLEMCDRDISREEWALEQIRNHVIDFVNIYSINSNKV